MADSDSRRDFDDRILDIKHNLQSIKKTMNYSDTFNNFMLVYLVGGVLAIAIILLALLANRIK